MSRETPFKVNNPLSGTCEVSQRVLLSCCAAQSEHMDAKKPQQLMSVTHADALRTHMQAVVGSFSGHIC